jgi:cytochrome c-type biogenesis protein
VGVGFAVAFAAGLLSFLSPCVLPLIPSYVGYLTGMTVEEVERRRGTAVLHALWFVAGFSLVFVLLGAGASAVGSLLRDYQVWLGRVGGVLLILFGLYLLGILRPAFLMRERRIQLARKPLGYFGSGVVGFTFGAAWTPCIGPILGGILTLAATQAGLGRGIMLLAVYALGLAIPFFADRTGVGPVSGLVSALPAIHHMGGPDRGCDADRAGHSACHRQLYAAGGISARTHTRVPAGPAVET